MPIPVALWASTKGGPRANVRHPGARWRHRAPWRCPVYPWAFWCQVTGLKIVQSWGHEWPTRMYFHMFISGAEAGKLIGKQGVKLKKMDEIPNLDTLQVCFYFDVHHCIQPLQAFLFGTWTFFRFIPRFRIETSSGHVPVQSELESVPQCNRHGLPKPKTSPTKNPEAKRSILKETEDVTSMGRPLNILPVPFTRPEAHRLRPASAMFEGRDPPPSPCMKS